MGCINECTQNICMQYVKCWCVNALQIEISSAHALVVDADVCASNVIALLFSHVNHNHHSHVQKGKREAGFSQAWPLVKKTRSSPDRSWRLWWWYSWRRGIDASQTTAKRDTYSSVSVCAEVTQRSCAALKETMWSKRFEKPKIYCSSDVSPGKTLQLQRRFNPVKPDIAFTQNITRSQNDVFVKCYIWLVYSLIQWWCERKTNQF